MRGEFEKTTRKAERVSAKLEKIRQQELKAEGEFMAAQIKLRAARWSGEHERRTRKI